MCSTDHSLPRLHVAAMMFSRLAKHMGGHTRLMKSYLAVASRVAPNVCM